MRVLLAGASGLLGQEVAVALKQRGHWVRALGRHSARLARVAVDERLVADVVGNPAAIVPALRDIDAVFSCIGQSVSAEFSNLRPGYQAIDFVGNRNLLDAARTAGVGRFVYVSVFRAQDFPENHYLRAHADVAALLQNSGLRHAIVEPTGFFSAFRAVFDLARKGQAVTFGDGIARSNPIHDSDLATICADAIESQDKALRILAGGPEILTRKQAFEIAFHSLGKQPRIRSLPAFVPGLAGSIMRPFAPRMGELMQFIDLISKADFIAPRVGTRTLARYFEDLARVQR